jgi:hypothetical protein
MLSLDNVFPIVAVTLLLVLLVAPVLAFCRRGWQIRKNSILSDFDNGSAKIYLETFHGNEFSDVPKADAMQKLAAHYDKHFSRRSFICPGIIGLAVAATLIIPCGASIHNWLRQQDIQSGPFPMVVVLAIAGGYVWVLFDVILKSYNQFLTPRDLYWAAFRLVICVPAGYALGALNSTLTYPIAFCLGALPAWTIRSIARRIVYRSTLTDDPRSDYFSQLVALPSVDIDAAQAMYDEGITCIDQLASWDPVKLTIRLGQPFTYVVAIMSDALLWVYLRSPEKLDAFRVCGVNGAYDCALLSYDLYDTEDVDDRKDARDIVKHLAKDVLKIPTAGIKLLLYDVANDPNTRFIYAVWGGF